MYYRSSEFCYSNSDESGRFVKIYNSAHVKQVFGADPEEDEYRDESITYVDICDSTHTPVRRWFKKYDTAEESQEEARYLVDGCLDRGLPGKLHRLGFKRTRLLRPLKRHQNLLDISE